MTLWVDAQLPPAIAAWMVKTFHIQAWALRDLSLRNAEDEAIFRAAAAASALTASRRPERDRRPTLVRLS